MEGGEHVEERRTVSYEEAFRVELHAFRQCVREGKKPETSIEDALGDARWVQAIARALPSPPPPKRRPPAALSRSQSRRRSGPAKTPSRRRS
jgi:hypothetical protein